MAERKSTWPRKLINQGLAGVAVTALFYLIQINLLVPPLIAGTFSSSQRVGAVTLLAVTTIGALTVAAWYTCKALAYVRSGKH